MYGRLPVPSGNLARAQEIYETVMELDRSLAMADVCVGYADQGASERAFGRALVKSRPRPISTMPGATIQ